MILSRLFSGAGGFLLAGLIVSAAAAGPQMTVEVELSELSDNVLHVFMLIEGNDQETLHLRGVPTYVLVHNEAEGCAPRTIIALARMLARRLAAEP